MVKETVLLLVNGKECSVNGKQCSVNGKHCNVTGKQCSVNGKHCNVNGKWQTRYMGRIPTTQPFCICNLSSMVLRSCKIIQTN